jgi:sugar lactone lactonase YvrE
MKAFLKDRCLALQLLIVFAVVTLSVPLAYSWTNGQNAAYVIGQADFTSNDVGTSDQALNFPQDVALDRERGKVYVADSLNNRVLRFAYPITANQPAAELVFGQPDFISNGTGISQNTLNTPVGVAVDGSGRLWVTDRGNHRVLWFNEAYAISSNQPDADGVLGQPDFTTNTFATTSSGMNAPYDMAIDTTGTIFVTELGNNRVLRFDNAVQKSNGADADGVLGQPDFTSNAATLSQSGMSSPRGVCMIGTSLFVADRTNARVLRFDNAVDKADGADADGVLGQADFISAVKVATQNGMDASARVVADDAGRLYVSDAFSNDRVLIYNDAVNKANGADADNVLGQPDFVSSGSGLEQNRLDMDSSGGGVAIDRVTNSLFVTDSNSNRVVVFVEPEMNVKEGAESIPDGGTYDFGRKKIHSETVVTFTIENLGSADLVLNGTPIIDIGGINADQFQVTAQPSSPVASNGSTTFQILFRPDQTGTKTATISISNTDFDENPYDLTITGLSVHPSDDNDICFIGVAADSACSPLQYVGTLKIIMFLTFLAASGALICRTGRKTSKL